MFQPTRNLPRQYKPAKTHSLRTLSRKGPDNRIQPQPPPVIWIVPAFANSNRISTRCLTSAPNIVAHRGQPSPSGRRVSEQFGCSQSSAFRDRSQDERQGSLEWGSNPPVSQRTRALPLHFRTTVPDTQWYEPSRDTRDWAHWFGR